MRPRRDRKPKLERQGKRLLATKSNEVWTFDFKGWWKTRDGKRFEPLTVRDAASRFILLCVHSRETFAAVKKHCVSSRGGARKATPSPRSRRTSRSPPAAAR